MNAKTWIPLVLAVVLGLVAMKLSKDLLARRNVPGEARVSLSEVVVTRRSLPAGTVLRADDLTTAKVGGDIAPESVFHDEAQVDGRVVTTALVKGQPVLEALLAPKGTGSGLQAVVPKGMRAITLEINEFSGLAGFLVPGCRVDVVSTINGEGGDAVSRTIVQNVEVTALGRRQQTGEESEPTKSVTLLVKPKEAEVIELAAATGRPRLVLRSSGDKDTAKSEGITVAELRGRKRVDPFGTPVVDMFKPTGTLTRPTTKPSNPDPLTPIAYQPPTREHTVKVIRGGVESEVVMQLPPEKGSKLMTDAK
jgi:pilus assembly protein CpaB